MINLRHLILWLIFAALAAVSASAREEIKFIESPHRSLTKTRALLAAVDLRVMLPLGYQLRPALAISGALATRQGVVENRVYTRQAEGGEIQIEVAIVSGLTGGYEFALYGDEENIGEVKRGLETLVRKSRTTASQEPELGYEMHRLGHIEADRALSLLKALGYRTIEFLESSKVKKGEPIFELVKEKGKQLPWIIKVVNASKTSLLEPDPLSKGKTSTSKSKGIEGAPQLGGSHLHNATTGAPEERLLLVYDRDDPEALEQLVNLLQTYIDVPARQIVIEALVIEVNSSRLQDLGVELIGSKGSVSGSFERSPTTNKTLGTFLFSRGSFADFLSFKGKLEALAETGEAKILSSPSVLVLNDRQARIQVGRQIPVARTTATTAAITKGVEYFPIGIVLNLRPRINRENTEVTMQIETIISSISPESAARLEAGSSDISFSPIVDNRLVETYVRVADGTPFIIGGLLSTERQGSKIGLPLISAIPFLGRLFSRERVEREQREVIVVITPHVVPLEDRSFSYLIPKDSEIFDRFDYHLFRNAYRVRDDDVWDLKFIRESEVLQKLVGRVAKRTQEEVMLQRKEPFRTLLNGNVPGEEVLVRRMLHDIVDKLDFHEEIDPEKVFFFEGLGGTGGGDDFIDRGLNEVLSATLKIPDRAVLLTYEARPQPGEGNPFSYPVATVRDTIVPARGRARVDFFREVNQHDADGLPVVWTIVLADEEDVRQLRQALILKRLLELNGELPLTLQAFRPGVQILFPTPEDMRKRYHLIDSEVAQLFYQTAPNQYYPAFERVFNRTVRQIGETLGGAGR